MKSRLCLLFSLIAAALPIGGLARPAVTPPDPLLASQIVDRYAEHIFYASAATGMALVAIDGNQKVFASHGETRPGNNIRPQKDSLIRIASLSKLMTSEVMIKLAERSMLRLDDPLSKYAPPGYHVPAYGGQTIRLLNLATHTSGLPREQPGGHWPRPVFVWPTHDQRWRWLNHARLKTPPGERAAYSNLAFDLLADALSRAAGQPYPVLLKNEITRPLGMKDTTFTPSPEQCDRLMIPAKGASPCDNTLAAIGSGGVYSTPDDMGRWMQQFLSSDVHARSPQVDRLQTLIYKRNQLSVVEGMDVPGKADALGLAWVYMAPRDGRPGIIEKTGGGGGFITYIAMVPEYNIGVFVVVSRSALTRFSAMSDGVNDLLTELVNNQS
ncbi:D-alanyl-D-alanine-carboxypeptidase/endopeptidase AmpH [Erwinia sp. OLTSP20]|uniref:D-alanyl-D-alanine- carboxypeptidase/endopeptidase AmpH n=1 Tax=unclassified Erwinia TaxID=2622719 RepID=UPI000C18FB0E|nr:MULTISPECIES: D-alanyl-D-alanine-carboxypeptidase/endopeptidase AmpH [unclassified Erwinia]PIJ50134.1 D-alanyl-D-alanine-carboxypeptidase/endopeptidase AmpH [Erwinia sp. OAMSP11]PIJ71900.1 D-alanyl-D-alanine-carboxypeptidase/endopeptidase AmpH [Erwinia sp. OLSSP12]PIJ81102.1 D-alanyl-D-alanine-carboxypeptidase/endopeptidase AmpH [Erwinia sp. OLCASP19]PIJ83532.1 D-alanyl-D-alanine-carboxypeptidase/endopeptidase AmpH [Erwinia sp. OLMTSP26]PIJ86147.1 D-alanyl-D-alanine-carboxypeptidase/endopep